MTMRLLLILVMWGLVAGATEPKAKPGDYPVHAKAGDVTVAAEYMVHSVTGEGQVFVVDGYLTVEVALYPATGRTIEVNAGRFTLRVNGKKQALLPQAPAMVAASLKYPDWERRPTLIGSANAGNAGVIVGRPRPSERFPGDRRAEEQRLPNPPRTPESENRSGLDGREVAKPEDVVVAVALPEGAERGAVAGYLYFGYRDKVSRIKSLELLYEDAILKLR